MLPDVYIGARKTYILIDAEVICTLIVTSPGFDICIVGTGTLNPLCPGIIKGRLGGAGVGGAPITGGSSPRALRDAIKGFSAAAVVAAEDVGGGVLVSGGWKNDCDCWDGSGA
jgi:hypothetical protein